MAQDPTKQKKKPNPLEFLRDNTQAPARTLSEELIKPMAKDFSRQLFGRPLPPKNYSGEIQAGESIEMRDVFSGQREREEKLQKQLSQERMLRQEESIFIEKRTNELRIQINAIHEEIVKLAVATPELSREVEIAAFSAPSEPSVYELNFLEQFLKFIKSFREKIEHAGSWLAAFNKRSSKKNMWGQNYKKHGAKYLLSGEHYNQRSAG